MESRGNPFSCINFENGEKFVGEWKELEPWNIDFFDKHGELLGQLLNGKIQKDENY